MHCSQILILPFYFIVATSFSLVTADTLEVEDGKTFTNQLRAVRNLAAICPPILCEERPAKFEFQYLGTKCSDSKNEQGEKFTCGNEARRKSDGKILISLPTRSGAYIKFIGKDGVVYFKNWVRTGKTFRFHNKGNKFPSDMNVEIYSGGDESFKLQSIRFHSSCSKNLSLGDVFGAVKLVGLYYKDQKNIVCKFTTNEPSAAPSAAPSLSPSQKPSVSPSKRPSPMLDLPPPPTDCPHEMCRESPKVMTFEFLPFSGTCASSSNSQDTDKFSCTDVSSLLDSNKYFIEFRKAQKNKKNKDNKKNNKKTSPQDNEIFFSGFVRSSDLIDIRADALANQDNSNKMKIPADMKVIVYGTNTETTDTYSMKTLQEFTFHSSCSQNLFISDTFGSIKLVGLLYKDGTERKCY